MTNERDEMFIMLGAAHNHGIETGIDNKNFIMEYTVFDRLGFLFSVSVSIVYSYSLIMHSLLCSAMAMRMRHLGSRGY